MRYEKTLFLATAAAVLCCVSPAAKAQISIGVNIGPEPSCAYGYYDYAPYRCAPYGYYGPEWFVGGRFIGAGQWHHGPAGFVGHVDNHYDPRHGYNGPFPAANEKYHGYDNTHQFHGNEAREGHGGVHEEHR